MSDEIELVRGGKNVFCDVGIPDAELMKSKPAAAIIGILGHRKLATRAAGELVGIHHSRISDIRNATLDRFSIERLVRGLNALDRHVTVHTTKADGVA